ncbi:Fucose mutarotase, partial [Dissostichus eleginoides]
RENRQSKQDYSFFNRWKKDVWNQKDAVVRSLLPQRFVQTAAESSDMCPSDKEKGTCCWLFSGNKESLIAAAALQ